MGKVILLLFLTLSLVVKCYCQNCQLNVSVNKHLWQYIWQIKDTTTCYMEFNVLFENDGDSICKVDLSSNNFFWKKKYDNDNFTFHDAPFEHLYLLLGTDTIILNNFLPRKDIREIAPREKVKKRAIYSLYSFVHNQFYQQHTHSKRSIRKYIRYLHKHGVLVFVHDDHLHKATLRDAKVEYNEWLLW